MLSDEERMAIEHLKNYPINWLIETVNESAIKIVLNLIEKQQKEIEELKDESKEYQIGFAQGCYEKDLDWLDKIKAKTIEIKNRPVKDEFITASQGKLNAIIDMESLLEKE